MARRSKKQTHFSAVGHALDLLVSGSCHSVIGSDFIMKRRDPYNADIGHLNPSDLKNYDQAFVNDMIATPAIHRIEAITRDWLSLLREYREQRQLLCEYQKQSGNYVFEQQEKASKELGNFDPYLDRIVLRNEAEMNVFYDYLALRCEPWKAGGRRRVVRDRLRLTPSVRRTRR